MSIDVDRPIIVGIDGSDDSRKAMQWAAHEADRHGWSIRLVHAYDPQPGLLPPVEPETPAQRGRRLLRVAHDEVTVGFPGLRVDVVGREGPAPPVLLAECRRGRMVVVGREGLGRLAELVLGSVSLAVATHARVPVVVVPAAWEPAGGPFGRVVVGVDGSANCQAAVETAFQLAAERGAALDVVFAWPHPSGMPHGWPPDIVKPGVRPEYHAVLDKSIDGLPEKFPDVPVTSHLDTRHPAEALKDRGHTADLVVIGGRGHGVVTGMLLGSVARAILRHVDIPIMVVHRRDEADTSVDG